MRDLRLFLLVPGIFALTVFLGDQDSFAQATRTIEVIGTATVDVKPDTLRIKTSISADGKTTTEAANAFTAKTEKIETLLGPMTFPELNIQHKGLIIAQGDGSSGPEAIRIVGGAAGGGAAPIEEGSFRAKEEIVLSINDIDRMESEQVDELVQKVISAAIEAGLELGNGGAASVQATMMGIKMENNVATYFVTDTTSARAKGYEAAMAEAARRANQLAELSEGKRGKVLSISAEPVNASADQGNPQQSLLQALYGLEQSSKGLSSKSNSPIQLSVALHVKFELLD